MISKTIGYNGVHNIFIHTPVNFNGLLALLASWPCLGSPSRKFRAAQVPLGSWCQAKSLYTRDWREAIDPIWGCRYFINRWSGRWRDPKKWGHGQEKSWDSWDKSIRRKLTVQCQLKRGWKMSETTRNWWFSGSMKFYVDLPEGIYSNGIIIFI